MPLVFGMDAFTFLVEILGVFRWRVVWRFPLIFASSDGYGTGRDRSFLGCLWTCFALISYVSGFRCGVFTFLVEILGVFCWRMA